MNGISVEEQQEIVDSVMHAFKDTPQYNQKVEHMLRQAARSAYIRGLRAAEVDKQTAPEHSEIGWVCKVLYTDLGMCGCGVHNERLVMLRNVLDQVKDSQLLTSSYLFNIAIGEWFLILLERAELIEHTTSLRYPWLTEKGERFLSALQDLTVWTLLTGDEPAVFCKCHDCEEL